MTANAENAPNADRPAQYFDAAPTVAHDERRVDVALPDVGFSMVTDAGVFSHGHLDTGTGVLLRTALPTPPPGPLLDLGCGAGPIALALAKRFPDRDVWAIDVNARARDLCAANAARNGLTNVRVAEPDAVPDDLRFAAIVSNPPIRIGKHDLHALLTTWLARLADAGVASLVVQKHLGADSLQRWLSGHGWSVDRLTSKAGFRVLTITAASTTPPS